MSAEESIFLLNDQEEKKDEETIDGSSTKWRYGRVLMMIWLQEVKKLSYIAGPLVAVILSQYLLQVISMMMVGHLGKLALSSTAIAISLAGVTGFSLMLGLACGLETLCGQAYGAQLYKKIGTQTLTSIYSLTLVCIPLSFLWIYMGKILIFLGQDPSMSHEAGRFTTYLVPALFAYATLQSLIRYLQAQSLVLAMFLSSCTTIVVHIPVCWVLVFKTGLRHLGAAVALDVSLWFNVVLLVLYIKFSSACERSRFPLFSVRGFEGVRVFFRFAAPSAVMVCLEWWSFELVILLSGLLPNPQLETSVLSICLTTTGTLYAIPYGIGSAASTRVSNELGAGNPERARLSVSVVMTIAVIESIVVSASLFVARKVFGFAFSNDKQVVEYVANMTPLVCLSVIMDSLQGVLSGIARGCGWQHKGAFVNLASFYLFGIPIAAVLGFWVHMRGAGLWIGILVGSTVQTTLLSIITARINWENEATKARERSFETAASVVDT